MQLPLTLRVTPPPALFDCTVSAQEHLLHCLDLLTPDQEAALKADLDACKALVNQVRSFADIDAGCDAAPDAMQVTELCASK